LKLALISDIHGNLAALEAVLDSIKRIGVDRIFCLGDIVGYGARPNECVDLVKSHDIPCICGNHDEVAISSRGLSCFTPNAKKAILWTQEQLTDESHLYLSELKFTIEFEGLLLVHASPIDLESWPYIFTQTDADTAFQSFTHPVCFFGHTHFPVIFHESEENRRLINVGSVGQPRDYDPRACWGLYDSSTGEFRWIRVEYNIENTVQEIFDAKLPGFLAERLLRGV